MNNLDQQLWATIKNFDNYQQVAANNEYGQIWIHVKQAFNKDQQIGNARNYDQTSPMQITTNETLEQGIKLFASLVGDCSAFLQARNS